MSQPENNSKSLIQDTKDLIDKTQTVLDIAKQIIQKPTKQDTEKESDRVKPDPTESKQ